VAGHAPCSLPATSGCGVAIRRQLEHPYSPTTGGVHGLTDRMHPQFGHDPFGGVVAHLSDADNPFQPSLPEPEPHSCRSGLGGQSLPPVGTSQSPPDLNGRQYLRQEGGHRKARESGPFASGANLPRRTARASCGSARRLRPGSRPCGLEHPQPRPGMTESAGSLTRGPTEWWPVRAHLRCSGSRVRTAGRRSPGQPAALGAEGETEGAVRIQFGRMRRGEGMNPTASLALDRGCCASRPKGYGRG
jgi:hypothetical protein